MQSPDFNGDQGVRLLVKHLNGEEITNRASYVPTIVTPYNLKNVR